MEFFKYKLFNFKNTKLKYYKNFNFQKIISYNF